MRHTVEIADSKGKTMHLSVSVDTWDDGGSWRSLDQGMIRYNSGAIEQSGRVVTGIRVRLANTGNTWGIELSNFTSWGTVNDKGKGTLLHSWALGLESGAIDWSVL